MTPICPSKQASIDGGDRGELQDLDFKWLAAQVDTLTQNPESGSAKSELSTDYTVCDFLYKSSYYTVEPRYRRRLPMNSPSTPRPEPFPNVLNTDKIKDI